jgi:hypothetical protein
VPDTALVRLENSVGRPTEYNPEYVEQAHSLALLGATDAEIAEHFGIGERTLYEWKNRYPQFSQSIKKGKIPADAKVAHALFDRATGAEWTEQQAIKLKTVTYLDGRRVKEQERVEIVEVRRSAPPDTTACIFYLKNRRPKEWRDRHEVVAEHDKIIRVIRINGLRDGDE